MLLIDLIMYCVGLSLRSLFMSVQLRIKIKSSLTLQIYILNDHKIVLPIAFAFMALQREEENKIKRTEML